MDKKNTIETPDGTTLTRWNNGKWEIPLSMVCMDNDCRNYIIQGDEYYEELFEAGNSMVYCPACAIYRIMCNSNRLFDMILTALKEK